MIDLPAAAAGTLTTILSPYGQLPPGGSPIAPILQQFVLNQIGYVGDLLALNPGAIPTGVATHLTKLLSDVPNILTANAIAAEELPSYPLSSALTLIGGLVGDLTNPPQLLTDLFEAPATVLDVSVNALAGVAELALLNRNEIATDIDPPLPSWLSGLAPAAATPKPTPNTVTLKVTPSTGGKTLTERNRGTTASPTSTPAAHQGGHQTAKTTKK